ncbi:MAG: hypothetical protein HYV63_00355 [Candidatus Schekmanbacteria bacterium]|nr:hypothetical protein [Candidatus Schekmanbacteria bacterium]
MLRQYRLVIALLGMGSIGLSGALYEQVSSPIDVPELPVAAATPTADNPAPARSPRPRRQPSEAAAGSYAVLAQKHPFVPDRTEPGPEVTPTPDTDKPPAAPPPTDLSLVGVVLMNDQRIAMLQSPSLLSGPKPLGFPQGSDVGGYTLATVERDHVVLAQGSEEITLELHRFGEGGPPPAAGEAPQPEMPPQVRPLTPQERRGQARPPANRVRRNPGRVAEAEED